MEEIISGSSTLTSNAAELHPATAKNLRVFGVGAAILLLVIWSLRFFYFERGNSSLLLGLAAYFLISGLLIHPLLKPIYQGWIWIAHKIGLANTYLILCLVYYLLITPIGIILRILGKDPLVVNIDRTAASYWILRASKSDLASYEKEF